MAASGGSEPTHAVEWCHPAAGGRIGIDLDLFEVEGRVWVHRGEVIGEVNESLEALDQNGVVEQTAGATHGAGEAVVAQGTAKELEELLAVDGGGGRDSDGSALPGLAGEELHLDAAETGGDDRPELLGGTDADKELGGETLRIGWHERAQEDADDAVRYALLEAMTAAAGKSSRDLALVVLEEGRIGLGNFPHHQVECRLHCSLFAGDDTYSLGLGLVGDVGRHHFEYHFVAGQVVKVCSGRSLADRNQTAGGSGLGADGLLQTVALVLIQAGAPLGVGLGENLVDLVGVNWH